MNEPLENLYFNWLCTKVNRLENPTPSLRYTKLFRILHQTEFVWLVSGDDNRVADGVELRDDFLIESGLPEDPNFMDEGCSVLEMLIAFSKRAEFATDEPYLGWFWEFIDNLGLRGYCDALFDSQQEITDILYAFVWRQYNSRGHGGGLFPLDEVIRDQTELEVWYQFCDYLADQDRMP
jgi:hypothetical protein